ncbi:sterol carrier protein domain-containing protein, partial [Mycobacteriaceae bacterium Msp059]|nr:sterol carrier protein domain-containing protein [Mycobacteriaceae bacterium Msp059]
ENSQTYRISPTGAVPTDSPAQLEADIEALAAALLGATRWHDLALAGLVRVNDRDAVGVADRLFAVSALPHTGIYF